MDKFPFTSDEKQPALSIEVMRARHRLAGRDYEMPVIAVAELNRIVLFWGKADGSWGSIQRSHEEISASPTLPSMPYKLEFSRNVAIASAPDGLVAAYRRKLNGQVALFIEAAAFQPVDDAYRAVSDPVAVPLGELKYEAAGLDVWLDWTKDELLVLTQTFAAGTMNPELTLLVAHLTTVRDVAHLSHSARWKKYTIDKGGFDLAARRDLDNFDNLHAVYRRSAGAISASAPWLWDSLVSGENQGALLVEQSLNTSILETSTDDEPLVWSRFELSSRVAQVVDEKVPGGEHPHIVALDPLWLIVTRHGGLMVRTRSDGHVKRVELAPSQGSAKFIVMQGNDGWHRARLLDANPTSLPGHARLVVDGQWLAEIGPAKVRFGTLLDTDPVHCIYVSRGSPSSKNDEIVLMHHDRWLGVLAATKFAVFPAEPASGTPVLVAPQGQSVLDVNHAVRHQQPLEALSRDDAELGQFAPNRVTVDADHPDGYKLRFTCSVRLTMGGLPVAARDQPFGFFAYTDMGDGGVRAVLRSDVSLPAFVPPGAPKKFDPASVPDLGGGGWIEIATPSHIALALPRYRAPYADFLRGGWNEDREFPLLIWGVLLVAAGMVLAQTFAPRSIVVGVQPALDLLPELDALFLSGAPVEPPLPVTLTPGSAATLQGELVRASPALESLGRVVSAPLSLSFDVDHSFLMQGSAYVFSAVLTSSATPLVTPSFAWTFTFELTGGGEEVVSASGPQANVTVPAAATLLSIALAATAGPDAVSTTSTRPIRASLWSTVTAIYTTLSSTGGVTFGSLSADLGAFRLDFTIAGAAVTTVTVTYATEYEGDYRFFDSPIPGQGQVELRLPVRITAPSVSPSGGLAWLAGLVTITDVDVNLRTRQRFTPGVLASDRRTVDPVQSETFRTIDGNMGRSIRGMPDVETVTEAGPVQGSGFGSSFPLQYLPAGLGMKPVGPVMAELASVNLAAALSPAAKTIGWLIFIVTALALVAPLTALVIVALVATGPFGAAAVAGTVALAALLAMAIATGLSWLVFDVIAPRLLTDVIRNQVTTLITDQLPTIAAALRSAGFARYTGEGLAEAVAKRAIEQAITDQLASTPPETGGRNRFRKQFFRMIVASEGKARIEIAAHNQ